MDVALRSQVDAELRQRRLERCQHPLGRETAVPTVRPEQARDVRPARLVEPDPEPSSEQSIEGAGVQALRLGEEALALLPQPREVEAESLVERAVGAAAQLGGGRVSALEHLAVGRAQLLHQVDARLLELLAALAVGLVRDRRTQISVSDGAAGHLRLERRLETRDALSSVALRRPRSPRRRTATARPSPPPPRPLDELAQLAARRKRRQVGMAIVDRLEGELFLLA